METLHVSCAADANYVAHSAAMLHSVLTNRGSLAVRVHFLHPPELPKSSAAGLAGMVDRAGGSIAFHAIADESVAGLPLFDRFPRAMWYRTFLPELLPEVDRIVYLDVDTIARDSLEPLWETNLDGHYVAAVTNVFQHNHLGRPRELGLDGPEVYFNSGVLLMNLREMRRDACSEAVRECARTRGKQLEWPDQDALNLVLSDNRLPLHPRWNVMNGVLHLPSSAEVFGREELAEARRHPAIRHFEGPGDNKPWHFMCQRDMREVYAYHRRATPWPDYVPEGVTPGNRLRRRLRETRGRCSRAR